MSTRRLGVVLTADSSDLEHGLVRSGRAVRSFTTGAESDFAALATGIGGQIVGITSATLALGVVLHRGWERFTQIEDASASLKITLGDTAKVSDLLASTLKIVQGTPFNLDQFISAGKNLIAVGEDASRIPTILHAIGEAAAASGNGAAGVGTIVDALQRMLGLGHANAEELNALSYQGVPAMQILANTFGVTTTEMAKMVSDGAVPARAAIDALVNGIEHGTQGAAGQTKALSGSMEELRKTASGALGGVGSAVSRLGAGIIGLVGGGKPGEVDHLALGLNAVSGGLDAVTHGLQRLAPVTGFLIAHKEVLEAVALLYGTKLVLAIGGLGVKLVSGAADWAAYQAVMITASIAANGVLKTVGSLALAAAPAALALGAVFAVESWQNAQRAAQAYVDTVTKGFDQKSPEGLQEASNALAAAKLHDPLGKTTSDPGFKGIALGLGGVAASAIKGQESTKSFLNTLQTGVETVIPFFGHGLRDAQLNIVALSKAQEANSKARLNEARNIQKLHELTGLSVADLRSVAKAAGVDLTGAVTLSGNARQQVLDWLKSGGKASLDFAGNLKDLEDSAVKTADKVASAFALVAGFTIPEHSQAVKDAADAVSALSDATSSLSDAQDKVRRNERYIVRTPGRDKELASARRDVAKAELSVADARKKANDASLLAAHPEQAIQRHAQSQVAKMTGFVSDLRSAIGKVDPHFLAAALRDPEAYGPILHAIATAHSSALAGAINANEAALRDLRTRITTADLGLEYAVQKGLVNLPPEIRKKIELALTAPLDVVAKIHYDFEGATPDPSAKPAAKSTAAQGSHPFGVHPAPGREWATGGIDEPHIATKTTIKYGEPSTGGEAYIPLGMQNRERSIALMLEVARRFGFVLKGQTPDERKRSEIVDWRMRHHGAVMPMESGGFVDRVRQPVFGGGVSVPLNSGTTIVKHQGNVYNTRHVTEVGEVRAHDYHDFERQMDRKARTSKLMGAM